MRAFWEQFRGGGSAPRGVWEELERKFGLRTFKSLVKLGVYREGEVAKAYPPSEPQRGLHCKLIVQRNPPGSEAEYLADPVCDCCTPLSLARWQVSEWVASLPILHRLLRGTFNVTRRAYPRSRSDAFKWLGQAVRGEVAHDVLWVPELTLEGFGQLSNRNLHAHKTLALVSARPMDIGREALRSLESSGAVILKFLSEVLTVDDDVLTIRGDDQPVDVREVEPPLECNVNGVIGPLTEGEAAELRDSSRGVTRLYVDESMGGPNHGICGYIDEFGEYHESREYLHRLRALGDVIEACGECVPLWKMRSIAKLEKPIRHFREARRKVDVKHKRNHWRCFHEDEKGSFAFRPPDGFTYVVIRRPRR